MEQVEGVTLFWFRNKLSQDKNIIIETIPKTGWKLTANKI
jgi:DNA-binding winged helix-turn-helix (wHTH) protein